MERCPNCRARCSGESVCRRCGSELAPLLRIEARTQALERLAVECLLWDMQAAEQLVERVLQLQQRPLALVLRGFIAQGRKKAGNNKLDNRNQ